MERLEMSLEKRLYKAAAEGDPDALRDLLKIDPFLLNTVSFTCPNKTPLHIATMEGHQPFVEEILNLNPKLAQQLDSNQASPLHMAAANGHLGIVQKLCLAAPRMSLSLDSQGRSPLHLAEMEGHSKVATMLLQSVMLTLNSSAKHPNALKMLMLSLNYLIDARDEDGNTILHMAVREKQIEVMAYLVEHTSIDVKAKNNMGQTAWDILKGQYPHGYERLNKETKRHLCNSYNSQTKTEKWLTENRDAVMVVAVLIATMAFQAVVSPPGGVWQEDNYLSPDPSQTPAPAPGPYYRALRPYYRAGEAVMAFRHFKNVEEIKFVSDSYKSFIRCNTVAFASSLSTIMFLISGLPFTRPAFMWFLMAIMWLTITSIAYTYVIVIQVITPGNFADFFVPTLKTCGILVWFCVMSILLVGNMIRLVDRWLKNREVDTVGWLKWILTWRPGKSNDSVQVKNELNGPENA